jgi:hypothetical protein
MEENLKKRMRYARPEAIDIGGVAPIIGASCRNGDHITTTVCAQQGNTASFCSTGATGTVSNCAPSGNGNTVGNCVNGHNNSAGYCNTGSGVT